jgi:uncharacterized BrkB/YihY/UPF0761 family membrane protein
LANVSLLHRFLSKIVIVVALTIVSAFMSGVVIVGLLWGTYWELTYHGVAPDTAATIVFALAILVTATFIGFTLSYARQLREPPRLLHQHFPGLAQLGGIADAFITGLLERPSPPKS